VKLRNSSVLYVSRLEAISVSRKLRTKDHTIYLQPILSSLSLLEGGEHRAAMQ
jgi:hypothetical protein